jgi:hypothetical protein
VRLDRELIRILLLRLEADDSETVDLANFSNVEIYHLKRLEEGGYLTIGDMGSNAGRVSKTVVHKDPDTGEDVKSKIRLLGPVRLTWNGHDYLEAIRDENVWQKTKDAVASEGNSIAFGLFKEVAIAFGRKQIEDRTGLKL